VLNPNLARRILVERPKNLSALLAIELDILELRENARPPRNDSRDPNERIKVRLTKVAKGVRRREFGDADVNFGVDTGVVGEGEEDNVKGDVVEDGEHGGGAVGEEVGEDRFRVGKVEEGDFEGFRVDCE
jgi:hypothetical protein